MRQPVLHHTDVLGLEHAHTHKATSGICYNDRTFQL